MPCSKLVPTQLSDPIPGADLPTNAGSIIDLQLFGDAQTGQLDKSNLTKAASLDIIRKCEERDRQIDDTLTKRKFLGIF